MIGLEFMDNHSMCTRAYRIKELEDLDSAIQELNTAFNLENDTATYLEDITIRINGLNPPEYLDSIFKKIFKFSDILEFLNLLLIQNLDLYELRAGCIYASEFCDSDDPYTIANYVKVGEDIFMGYDPRKVSMDYLSTLTQSAFLKIEDLLWTFFDHDSFVNTFFYTIDYRGIQYIYLK